MPSLDKPWALRIVWRLVWQWSKNMSGSWKHLRCVLSSLQFILFLWGWALPFARKVFAFGCCLTSFFFLHPLSSMSTCSLLLDLRIYTVVWHSWGQSGGWGECKDKWRIIEFWSWIKAPKVILFTDKELSPRERR